MKTKLDYLKENIGNLTQVTVAQTMVNILDELINPKLTVKFAKTHPKAVIPHYNKPGDAGLDLTAVDMKYVRTDHNEYYEYDLGLSVEVPEGHVALIFPRSSVSTTDLVLANNVGVVDSGYRGNLTARFRKLTGSPNAYKIGDRVAQMVVIPYPTVVIKEVDYEDLSKTERGTSGWGSSGR